MGIYLNSKGPYTLYKEEVSSTYFVDKSDILKEFVPLADISNVSEAVYQNKDNNMIKGSRYICITRPRRFGKTIMANMISSYFGKGADGRKVFDNLKVSKYDWYHVHLNRHNVIHIVFSDMPVNCSSYTVYIERIQRKLLNDLKKAYPNVEIEPGDAVWDILGSIFEYENEEKFIFIFDEWDFIYHQKFVTGADKDLFTKFLSNLLKDKPYVEFVYMTGILPIAKYSSGSELNMFSEYTMVNEERFSDYFGFTEEETDELFDRYQEQNQKTQKVTREALRIWYDGYSTKSGRRVYNPRSVVLALTNNNLGNYWTSSGPYDEIFYYIKNNVDDVREDIALMVSGIAVRAKVREYAAASMNLNTKDEIFSAMVVYGFLNYKDGFVSIPNKELMDKFADMVEKESSLGYVYRLAKESERMLMATKAMDAETVSEILEYAHNTEIPLLSYHHETELTMIVNMVYLSARDTYRIEREDKAGVGYVDFIFYPLKENDDCIILELKVDSTPDKAIAQIKDRKYALKFEGKIAENKLYTGRILAVGISYNKKSTDKRHECKIEVLRERMEE